MICGKCGREKILVEQAITGFPGYHVCGTRQVYCGYCGKLPIIELTVGNNAVRLCPNVAYNNPNERDN